MDITSQIAALKASKPTIASRRPMLNSQRSLSALSINTSATHSDFLRRRNASSSSTTGSDCRTTSPYPLATSASASMSPEELSSKIADSFQQFSNMLSQLSTKTPSQKYSNKANAVVKSSTVTSPTTPVIPVHVVSSAPPTAAADAIVLPLLSSSPPPKLQPTQATIKRKSIDKPKKKANKKLTLPTADCIGIDDTKLLAEIYCRHAVFNERDNLDDLALLLGNKIWIQHLLSRWFNRAASIGDLHTMERMIAATTIDINETDDRETGITPLMYAAYFGHVQCLKMLLDQKHSIQINHQDKNGWTALIWAIHGQQLDTVAILLRHGADKSIKTKHGRTVYRYPTLMAIKEILGREQEANTLQIGSPTTSTPYMTNIPRNTKKHSKASTEDDSQQHTNTKNTESATTKSLPPDFSQLLHITLPPKEQQQLRNYEETSSVLTLEEEQDLKRWEASLKASRTFSWNQCLADQMFVFSQDEMHYILDRALHVADTKSLANKSPLSSKLWQPANIVFLSARFAHYYSNRDLLNLLLDATARKLSRIIKNVYRDTQTLAFWIANMCQLSSYLKRDPGLCIPTTDAQETLSELISEGYSYFVTESQKRLEKMLSSVMDYEPIHELNQVDFADDWQRFFRRSSHNLSSRKSVDILSSELAERKYSLDATSSSSSSDEATGTPQLMTHLLTDLLHMLQSYHVPPAIVIQAMAQFFHYLSCEMFNQVLTYKKYLCRSKALQIRMNLSALEDWVRVQKLPSSLNHSFEPLVQLLQLLQCMSQLDNVLLFTSTIQTFDKLNALQIKRCVQNYRYEVTESRLPDHVVEMANQCVLNHQLQLRNQRKTSIEVEAKAAARPASVSSLNSLLSPTTRQSSLELPISSPTTATTTPAEEKRNSKYLLPFSISETTALLQGWTNEQHKYLNDNDIILYSDNIYKEIKLKKQEEFNVLDKIFPTITEEWLYSIDK
ncbi:hypothetical protein [Parasitella parasitica]|uniref:Dilute domain-containing protein n=1 Tax=Parasitella parasitica TaxID=35722 RepID=A0A0B7MXN8_9FUNG|nr:hypothetical protein [Parasitella parasitica]